MIIINILTYIINIKKKIFILKNNYFKLQNEFNLSFQNKINRKIRVGIFAIGLKNGGRARITSQLLKYINNNTIFEFYLFTQKKKRRK